MELLITTLHMGEQTRMDSLCLGTFAMELTQGHSENGGPAVVMLFCEPQGCSSLLD